MYIKVCPHKTRNHHTFECERYSLEEIDVVALSSPSDKTYAFPVIPDSEEGQESAPYKYELWLYSKDKLVAHLLLLDCVVYITGNEGTTIDTIWI